MFLRNFLLSIILVLAFILSFFSCAQVGSPAGGAKDSLPPVILLSKPPNFSTEQDVDGFKVKIYFDEYIQLKELNKMMYISPLTEEDPEVKLNGKKLMIKIDDSLMRSVTYSISFGNSIQDNNEGNPLENYKYIFSTGEMCDSLSVRGQLLNAFDHEVVEDVWVMLYDNFNDSTPIKERPSFVARTDTAGRFSIEYIRAGEYRIFALKDENRNFLFDMPNEQIAFSDTILLPEAKQVEITDTLKRLLPDSTFVDSIVTRNIIQFTPENITLRLFEEDHKRQYLVAKERAEKWKLSFVFNRNLWNDTISIVPLNFEAGGEGFIKELSQKLDSVTYWLSDTITANVDSLEFAVSYMALDSLQELNFVTDTVLLRKPKKKEKAQTVAKKRKNKKDEDKEKPKNVKTTEARGITFNLKIKDNASGTMDLNNDLIFYSETPLEEIDAQKIRLELREDTIYKPVKFTFAKDTVWHRMYRIKTEWEEDASYKLFVDTLAFVDYYSQGNDTITKSFKTRKLDYYSQITLNLSYKNIGANAILQLLKKDKIIKELYIKGENEPQEIIFDYLPAGDYFFKIIFDSNGNRKWDTGNYLKKIQAEEVRYFDKTIPLKENWTDNQEWVIE